MTPAEFKALYTEFAAEPDLRVQTFLDDAGEELGAIWDCYPARKERAIGLLAAHNLKAINSAAAGVSGPVTSESVGDLSRSYGSAGEFKTAIGSTPYGQQFDRLKRMTVAAITVLDKV